VKGRAIGGLAHWPIVLENLIALKISKPRVALETPQTAASWSIFPSVQVIPLSSVSF